MNDLEDSVANAAKNSDLEGVIRCVEAGVDATLQDFNGMTALLYASSLGLTRMIEYLLDVAGSDVNEIQRGSGKTVLMMAILGCHFKTMQYLVEVGKANLKAVDSNGGILYHLKYWAHLTHHKRLTRFCGREDAQYHADLTSLLRVLVMSDNPNCFGRLQREGSLTLEDCEDSSCRCREELRTNRQQCFFKLQRGGIFIMEQRDLIARGGILNKYLPAYTKFQQETIFANTPVPVDLQKLIVAYSVTTSKDMWAAEFRVQLPRAKRRRPKSDDDNSDDDTDDSSCSY